MTLDIAPLTPEDGGELLTLSRAPLVTEAQLYGDPRLPALVETLRVDDRPTFVHLAKPLDSATE